MESLQENSEYCYINGREFKTETIKEICLVESKNCLSVSNMLLKLGGHNSQFEFFEDQAFANEVYETGKKDLVDMGMKHNIYYVEGITEGNVEALLSVVHYKRSKLQRSRLVVLACLKANYIPAQFGVKPLTFVRFFHLPCKYNNPANAPTYTNLTFI